MTIGITGAAGFFGWHLRCRLFALGLDFVSADRSTFADQGALDAFLEASDVVVHLAGVNRAASDEEVASGNIDLANKLADGQERTGTSFDVVYANTIKADDPGPYGESKAQAGRILESCAMAGSRNFVDIKFPHLFGEFGVPHYNSAVTTFAHQLVRGETSRVNDGKLELLHVQDASQIVIDAVNAPAAGLIRPEGRKIGVPAVYSVLERLADYASSGTFPHLAEDDFELRLFNTLRSQMWPQAYPMPLTKHEDHRGSFFEVTRAWGKGQTSMSTTHPGISRGDHFHLDKIERFVVISGQATIRVRRVFTDEIQVFEVSGERPVVIDMPSLCTHDITNTGDTELVTIFWSHDHFDPANGDTYPLLVAGKDLPA